MIVPLTLAWLLSQLGEKDRALISIPKRWWLFLLLLRQLLTVEIVMGGFQYLNGDDCSSYLRWKRARHQRSQQFQYLNGDDCSSYCNIFCISLHYIPYLAVISPIFCQNEPSEQLIFQPLTPSCSHFPQSAPPYLSCIPPSTPISQPPFHLFAISPFLCPTPLPARIPYSIPTGTVQIPLLFLSRSRRKKKNTPRCAHFEWILFPN